MSAQSVCEGAASGLSARWRYSITAVCTGFAHSLTTCWVTRTLFSDFVSSALVAWWKHDWVVCEQCAHTYVSVWPVEVLLNMQASLFVRLFMIFDLLFFVLRNAGNPQLKFVYVHVIIDDNLFCQHDCRRRSFTTLSLSLCNTACLKALGGFYMWGSSACWIWHVLFLLEYRNKSNKSTHV